MSLNKSTKQINTTKLDVIFIVGCPASGKSTVSKYLQEELNSPFFEFGWIPEYRNLNIVQTYEDEEKLSFENLNLVVKNYVKHGYKNIILTDIRDNLITKIPSIYKNYSYHIFTLIPSVETIKNRINQRKIDDQGFSEISLALKSNDYWNKSSLTKQTKFHLKNETPEEIANLILVEIRSLKN